MSQSNFNLAEHKNLIIGAALATGVFGVIHSAGTLLGLRSGRKAAEAANAANAPVAPVTPTNEAAA